MIPDALQDRLPDGFDFQHAGAQYMWLSMSWPRTVVFGSRHVGALMVRHTDPGLAEAMKSHRGPTVYWTPQYTTFVISG